MTKSIIYDIINNSTSNIKFMEPKLKEDFPIEENKNEKISSLFKKALVVELQKILNRTNGINDKKFYRRLIAKIETKDGLKEILEGGEFSEADLLQEYSKQFENGDKMLISENLISENLSDVAQYLQFRFKEVDEGGDGSSADSKTKTA